MCIRDRFWSARIRTHSRFRSRSVTLTTIWSKTSALCCVKSASPPPQCPTPSMSPAMTAFVWQQTDPANKKIHRKIRWIFSYILESVSYTHLDVYKRQTHSTPGLQNHRAAHHTPRAAQSHTRISPVPPVPATIPMRPAHSKSPHADCPQQKRTPMLASPARAVPAQASSWINSRMLQCGSLPSHPTGQEMHGTYLLLPDIGRGSSIRGHNKTARARPDPHHAPAAPHKCEGSGRCPTFFLCDVRPLLPHTVFVLSLIHI